MVGVPGEEVPNAATEEPGYRLAAQMAASWPCWSSSVRESYLSIATWPDITQKDRQEGAAGGGIFQSIETLRQVGARERCAADHRGAVFPVIGAFEASRGGYSPLITRRVRRRYRQRDSAFIARPRHIGSAEIT